MNSAETNGREGYKKIDRGVGNVYFLLMTLLLTAVFFLPDYVLNKLADGIVLNSVVSEMIIVVPAILMIGIWYAVQSHRQNTIEGYIAPRISDRLMYRSVKPTTLLMCILYTMCIMPLITLCNCITMIFVDNTVLEYSTDIIDTPVPMAVFAMAILPPLCEELAFRGLIYGGYRRACRPLGAVLISAFLFGIMHGNINQFAYAFVIGIALAILAEATGSIWPTIFVHFLINARTVLAMFIIDHFNSGIFEEYLNGDVLEDTGSTYIVTLVYAVLSVITVLMSGAIISWISQNEGMDNPLKTILKNKEFKASRYSVWTVSLVIGVILSVGSLILIEYLTYMG